MTPKTSRKYLQTAFLAAAPFLMNAHSPIFAAPPAQDQIERVNVFTGGEAGYPTVRIPSIILSKKGTLLAFAEGRKNLGDQAENKIILRRSTDGGKSWQPLQTIADDGKRPLNNPCAVVEEKSGRVLLMFQSYPENLKEADGKIKTGYDGSDIVKSYLIWSDDDGKSWSEIKDITRQVKRPTGVTTVASGPGIGIQLRSGAHAGRLLIPFNEGPFGKWNIYAAYSDDGGANWQYGDVVPQSAGLVNECQLAEMDDGRLRFNSRRGGGASFRKSSVSGDGGLTWTPAADTELFDPTCMASIIKLRDPARSRMLFAGPLGPGRSNGTVHVSYDDGATWPIKKTLFPGNYAYSNLVALPDGTLGDLYETDGHQHIAFARFSLQNVTDGRDEWGLKPNKAHDLATIQARVKSAVPLTWLLTGDSITHGARHTKGQRSYPELFEAQLRSQMNRAQDVVINTGISGDMADGIVNDFHWRVGQFSPDVVSINIGMNDATKGETNRGAYEKQLRELVRRVRGLGAIPIIATTNTIQTPGNRGDLANYNAIVEKIAQSEDVILVDHWQRWQNAPKTWFSDAIHPNPQGHVEMTKAIFQTLGIDATKNQ